MVQARHYIVRVNFHNLKVVSSFPIIILHDRERLLRVANECDRRLTTEDSEGHRGRPERTIKPPLFSLCLSESSVVKSLSLMSHSFANRSRTFRNAPRIICCHTPVSGGTKQIKPERSCRVVSKAHTVISILLISIFLLVAAFFAIYLTKRLSPRAEARELLPTQSRGLFDAPLDSTTEDDEAIHQNLNSLRASELRARAAAGDLTVLRDAHLTGDTSLYREILDTLIMRGAGSPDTVRDLSSCITKGEELRSTPLLAGRLLENWELSPAEISIADLLRIAALSDDAGMYQRAVVAVFNLWKEGRLPQLRADQLHALFESEHWLLSGEARRSGEGFILRDKLAGLRRQIAASKPREITHSNEADAQTPPSH